MAYSPPTHSLNFLIHGSRAHDFVPIPPHIEIVLFTEHDEALTSAQASLVFSWLRKNYEQGVSNVLLQPVFIKTPQRRYRIGRQSEGPILPFRSEENAAGAIATSPPGVSPWSFRQGGGGRMELSGLSGLIRVPPAPSGGGGGGGPLVGEPLVTTVVPSQPQPPVDQFEFSVTLSVYSHTQLRNLCPNIVFTFEDDFQVNPIFPTSMLGIYKTEGARLQIYNKDVLPASRSGRDLDLNLCLI